MLRVVLLLLPEIFAAAGTRASWLGRVTALVARRGEVGTRRACPTQVAIAHANDMHVIDHLTFYSTLPESFPLSSTPYKHQRRSSKSLSSAGKFGFVARCWMHRALESLRSFSVKKPNPPAYTLALGALGTGSTRIVRGKRQPSLPPPWKGTSCTP